MSVAETSTTGQPSPSNPSHPSLRVLLVGHDATDRSQLGDVTCSVAGTLRECLARLAEDQWDVVLLDLDLPDSRGLATLSKVLGEGVSAPIVVLTDEVELARQAMREGAADSVPKSALTGDQLARSVRHARKCFEYEMALREATERLRQAEKLGAIGQLAGGIAHDFNNMLAIVLGNVELAMESSGQELLDRLADIRDAGDRAQGLTRQLLAVARQRHHPRPEPVDLTEIVRKCDGMLRSAAGSGVQLDIELPAEPVWIPAETSQLEQILLNLLVNARDAVGPEGGIRISLERRPLSPPLTPRLPDEHSSTSMAHLSIEDDGCGIDPELLPRIFEPFVTSRRTGTGTGLGLATVNGIVKQLGGEIEVQSEVGEGTSFVLTLPLARAAPSTSAEVTAVDVQCPPAEREETILLVDDELPLRRLVQRILEGLGYRVIAAKDPDDALRHLGDSSRRVDLLVTDVVMPEMDGRALAAAARELRPHLPALLVSGYMPGTQLARETGPGTSFLQKPVSRETLARAVRKLLDDARATARVRDRQSAG